MLNRGSVLALVLCKMIRAVLNNHKHAREVPCVKTWEILWTRARLMHLLTHMLGDILSSHIILSIRCCYLVSCQQTCNNDHLGGMHEAQQSELMPFSMRQSLKAGGK